MKFGINIENYVKEHEQRAENNLITEEEHLQKLKWLQHERLVHLIVTMSTCIMFFIALAIFLQTQEWVFSTLPLILLVLNIFYLKHYFFLENHTREKLKNNE